VGAQAQQRRERAIERRIRDACFREVKLLEEPARLNYWTRFEWLIIDEFGFDRLERTLSPQAANLLYKVIDGRSPQRSTGLVTNIDFEAWADYLGDPPLAMAFLDRVVDGAILLKIQGRSYRAHRAQRPTPPPNETPS
jgi:DNA replication protein DnaC